MAKFIYKMQNLLSIKLKLEEQAKNAFGEARARLNQEEEKLSMLEGKKQSYERQLSESIAGKLNIREICQTEEAVEIMKYKIRIQSIAVTTAMQQLELARVKLNEAIQERKIQENLREQAFLTFMEELKVEEQKEVDERVSFMYRDSEEE
ncbi:MAG: flagellar export protein FliJ [Acetivibrio ethanolgignens]